ncbi:hypothetical protein HNP84_006460 [Thermocatellispora tengchongensis]|uniref:Uncharacterized protein n=1 Tax=Thermocatellispora tengchongensis TaxID=1073253 RepID=A0A840PCJ6_9ACTN|nr:hypothetical protein [Thermocatellispora tengchongensis]
MVYTTSRPDTVAEARQVTDLVGTAFCAWR